MKVAVSIPDPIFTEAEVLAVRLKTSRSDVYTQALAAFVKAQNIDVTEQINAVVDAVGADESDFYRRAARRVAERNEW
jgi:metal-responsive CopG/Arc/MetJ family transcriptional regulator